MNKKEKFSKDEVELVIERLMAMPNDALISMGINSKPMNKDELVKHVKKQDEAGKKILKMHLFYLRSHVEQ